MNPVQGVPLEARLREYQHQLENLQTEEQSVAVLHDIALDGDALREIRKTDPELAGHVDAYLAQHWLPLRNSRRIIMIVLLLIGIGGFFYTAWTLVMALGALLFSPRIVALLSTFLERLKTSN